MGKEWISASDIEKFGYCPLSWWLSRGQEDVTDDALERGKEEHEKVGKELEEIKKKERKLNTIENIILGLAISATVISIWGLTLLHPEQVFSKIFIVLALIWLLASTFFLFLNESHKKSI